MFTIALFGKNPEFNNTIRDAILHNGNGSGHTMNDFLILENESFRIISNHNFFDEKCPCPDQQRIDFLAHSYDGIHLFILAIDSENAQIEEVATQIMKLQGIFGETVTEHLVVMLDSYTSYTLLGQLKDKFNIELKTLSEHVVHDCMMWCSSRQLFLHNYKDYSEEVVKKRKQDLERNEHHLLCKYERSGPANFQSTSYAPAEPAPEEYHGTLHKIQHNICERKSGKSKTEFNIVLLGLTGTGKSASGNTILTAMNPQLEHWQPFESKPSSTPVTTKCQFKMMSLFGRQVRVVDTPDFFHDDKNYQAEVDECKKFCQPGRCVVLLVIQMGRFTEGEWGILEMLEKKLGWKIRTRTIVLLTHGENAKEDLQSFIDERSPLRHIVTECGYRFHVFKNTSRRPKQVMELFKKIPDYQTIFPGFTEYPSNSGCCLA